MKKVYGISLSIGSYEHGLWYDHDEQEYNPHGFGITLKAGIGKFLLPIKKYWLCWELATPEWREKMRKRGKPWWQRIIHPVNAWKHPEHVWFTLRCPVFPVLFFSISLGSFGFYVGVKSYRVTQENISYRAFLREDEIPPAGEIYYYVHTTATIRRTRWR